MNSTHILISVISISVLWGCNVAWRHWLSHKAKAKAAEAQTHMSRLEQEKMELMSRVLEVKPPVNPR